MTQYSCGQCVGTTVGVYVLVGSGVLVGVSVGVSVGTGVFVGSGVSVGAGAAVGGGISVGAATSGGAGMAVRVARGGMRVSVGGASVGCIVNSACATRVGTICAISVALGVG